MWKLKTEQMAWSLINVPFNLKADFPGAAEAKEAEEKKAAEEAKVALEEARSFRIELITLLNVVVRRTERIPVSENEAILQMKKRALVNAFCRPEDRIADDAHISQELESPNMTSDDESPMQHQEDIGDLDYQSESMVENPPPRGKENSEHQPHSATQHQSSEYSAQHQSESEGFDHQPSPATPNKASDNLSVRQGRGRPKDGSRNGMIKPTSPQGGPSSGRPSSKENPLVLAEVIVISSDDEHLIQRKQWSRTEKMENPPETTRTRSSKHSAQIDFEYRYEPPSYLSDRRQEGSAKSQIQPLASSAQYERREISAGYQPELTPCTNVPDHSINRVEESYPELNDWNSLYGDEAEENEEHNASNIGEHAHLQNVGVRDSKEIERMDQVDHKEDRIKQRFEGGSQGDIGQPTTKRVLS
ncbi:hypothetical protein BHYA_0007g00720 [Botrytis hyacinthi]|uniref:Uncharacterized protein n=1 Tax=Botrytis hyacinthi TaxID=278943 RepID=A0A4Z1H4X2_9HELO|nr:hypothetical protein BHYA_0007g00720 [Botrytis hyacinthi]